AGAYLGVSAGDLVVMEADRVGAVAAQRHRRADQVEPPAPVGPPDDGPRGHGAIPSPAPPSSGVVGPNDVVKATRAPGDRQSVTTRRPRRSTLTDSPGEDSFPRASGGRPDGNARTRRRRRAMRRIALGAAALVALIASGCMTTGV